MKCLIAEDDPVYMRVLSESLCKWSYQTVCVQDGQLALETLSDPDAGIDMALLDWMMPGMKGPEICSRLRENKAQYVYVVLLSCKKNVSEIAQGLDAGADDYVTKPFDLCELRSRLRAGSRVIDYERSLAAKNMELEQFASRMEALAQERAMQLVHAERIATLGLLAPSLAHEITNPTAFIAGNQQTLEMYWNEISHAIETGLADAAKLGMIKEGFPAALEGISNGVQRINSIVDGFRRFARRDKELRRPCNMNDCVRQSLNLCRGRLKKFTIRQDLQESLPPVCADAQQIQQVLVNLFTNAADAMEGMESTSVTVSTCVSDARVVVTVRDEGRGINEEALQNLWKPFFTSKPPEHGTGLGLFVSKGIIDRHGGTVAAANASPRGACFTIRLPIHEGEKAHGRSHPDC
jgi:two-component system NtrC family sensor kinase